MKNRRKAAKVAEIKESGARSALHQATPTMRQNAPIKSVSVAKMTDLCQKARISPLGCQPEEHSGEAIARTSHSFVGRRAPKSRQNSLICIEKFIKSGKTALIESRARDAGRRRENSYQSQGKVAKRALKAFKKELKSSKIGLCRENGVSNKETFWRSRGAESAL